MADIHFKPGAAQGIYLLLNVATFFIGFYATAVAN
jgi:hypothetical protein